MVGDRDSTQRFIAASKTMEGTRHSYAGLDDQQNQFGRKPNSRLAFLFGGGM